MSLEALADLPLRCLASKGRKGIQGLLLGSHCPGVFWFKGVTLSRKWVMGVTFIYLIPFLGAFHLHMGVQQTIRVSLPIRATHSIKGKTGALFMFLNSPHHDAKTPKFICLKRVPFPGYLGLIADSGTCKYRPLYLKESDASIILQGGRPPKRESNI